MQDLFLQNPRINVSYAISWICEERNGESVALVFWFERGRVFGVEERRHHELVVVSQGEAVIDGVWVGGAMGQLEDPATAIQRTLQIMIVFSYQTIAYRPSYQLRWVTLSISGFFEKLVGEDTWFSRVLRAMRLLIVGNGQGVNLGRGIGPSVFGAGSLETGVVWIVKFIVS